MILSIKGKTFQFNDMTLVLDKCRLEHSRCSGFRHISLFDKIKDDDKIYALRYPGYTMGHIKVNNDDIITEIKIYTASHIRENYPEDIDNRFDEFIGEKFIVLSKDNFSSIDTDDIESLIMRSREMEMLYNDNTNIYSPS